MNPDPVAEVVAVEHVEEAVSDASSASRLKTEPGEATGACSVPFIQRVVAVPPSSVETWPNQMTETKAESSNPVEPAPSAASSNVDQSADAKQYCCLLDSGKRCHRIAGNASFSRKINKMASQKGLKLNTDINCKHIYICDHHKNLIQRVRTSKVIRKKEQASDDENTGDSTSRRGGQPVQPDSPVDSAANRLLIDNIVKSMSLQVLRRYRQAHKLSGKAGSKIQLQELVACHFETVPVCESDIVLRFFRVLRLHSNKLDQQLPAMLPTASASTSVLSTAKCSAFGVTSSSKNSTSGNVAISHPLHSNNGTAATISMEASASLSVAGNQNLASSSWA